MDLEEWEILPSQGINHVEDEYDQNYEIGSTSDCKQIVFEKDYFLCPSPTSDRRLLQLPTSPRGKEFPVWLEPRKITPSKPREERKVEPESIQTPIDVTAAPSSKMGYLDQEVASQVFFKELKENEFADMKVVSPRATSPRANALPQLNTDSLGFDDMNDPLLHTILSSPRRNHDRGISGSRETVNGGGLNLWKWSLNGVGAIFSFGLAATSFCLIILRSQKQQEHKLQRLRFQIYADEKRIKEVVHHATKLNQAMSAGRVTVTGAQISYGGYYDGV